MADKAPDKQPAEDSNVSPLNINVENTRSAQRSGECCGSGSTSGTFTASLSSAGLQSPVSPLPVQLGRGRVVNAYNYLPPQSVHLQGNTEQQQILGSVGPYPPTCVWGTTTHPPVPYYGSVTYPYRNISSPMQLLYRYPHLQPVPNLQLEHMQPPGQRHSQPASVQDGRGPCFYNQAVLTPRPVRQTSPIAQPDRAVPVPSAPTNKAVKKAEHQSSVKIRTNVAHRQEHHRPRVVYHIPETAADQEECQSNASQLTDPFDVLQRSLETTSSSLDHLSSVNVNVLSTQPGTQESHQPHLLQPEDQETAGFKDEFQLPQDLLNKEHFPDSEKPSTSIEPPIDSKEATQDSSLQKMSLERATGKKEVKNIRRETQGKSTREKQPSRKAYACPGRTSLLPATRKSEREGVVPTIDLCGSEDEEPRILKSNVPNRDQKLEEPQSKLPAASFIGKGSFPERQKTVLPPIAFAPRRHHLEGENDSTSGQGVYERGGAAFGNSSIPGPTYIVDDGSRPTPKTLVAPNDNTKVKYLKKTRKTNYDTLGTGERHLSSKETSDLQLPTGKRKTTLTGGEPLCKISGKLPGLDLPRPKGSTSGSEKVQSTQQCKKTSGYTSKKELHQQREERLKGISTKQVELPAHTTGLIRVQSDAYSEQHLAKRSRQEKTTSSKQEPPVKEKMNIFNPEAELLDKKRKRSLDRELSGSHSRDLQTGLKNSETMKNTSKEQLKDKAKANANPDGTKEKKKAKIEAKTVKQIPRSNLALHMMESVKVFYPLGKSNLSAFPCKKIPSVTSPHTISDKTPAMLPRPLPWPLLPQPLSKPLPSTLSRQQPSILPKPPSSSPPKSSSLPKPVTSLSKPILWEGPKPPVSGPLGQPATRGSQFSRWRAQPMVVEDTPVPSRLPDCQMRSSNECDFLPSCPGRSSSPVQEFDGATVIPWRTPPNDLEVSTPISEEQRPIREMMRQQAQQEREEAAWWTYVRRRRYFGNLEKEMDTPDRDRCPWRH